MTEQKRGAEMLVSVKNKITILAGPSTHISWTPDYDPNPEKVVLVRASDLVALEKRVAFLATPKPEAAEGPLERVLVDAMASLAAAISLLERGSKKAAPSDRMFDQMLNDYRASLKRARIVLANAKPADGRDE